MASVKECLTRLTEQNVDMSINKHVKYLIENVDERQLEFKLAQNGIKIDGNMIQLYYHPGIGFQCKNMFVEKYGRLPLCNYIERFLNEELRKVN
jgi:hypothetical protein